MPGPIDRLGNLNDKEREAMRKAYQSIAEDMAITEEEFKREINRRAFDDTIWKLTKEGRDGKA